MTAKRHHLEKNEKPGPSAEKEPSPGLTAELQSQTHPKAIDANAAKVKEVATTTTPTGTEVAFVADPSKAEAAIAAIYNRLSNLPVEYRLDFYSGHDQHNPIIQHLMAKDKGLKPPSDLV
jgi:phosphotransferase system HPr-like phosphotransfer protein